MVESEKTIRNIMIVEDNKDINEMLSTLLEKEGYQVFSTYNAFDAYKIFHQYKIDCILTDLMLPIKSGEELIKDIRKESNVHIIIISAKTSTSDKITGLQYGADDYLFKPFLEEEVVIKLRNLFQKKHFQENQYTYNQGEVVFMIGKTEMMVRGVSIPLTSVEYQIVKQLIVENNRVVTREQFLDVLYQFGEESFDRVIDVHIKNIRKKINISYDKELIKTVYGLGYCWAGVKDE